MDHQKTLYFKDFWDSFCWRLWRPWMLLSTKSKGHKSKFRISWMYRYHFYELKVHFWWLNKRFFLVQIEFEHPVHNWVLTLVTFLVKYQVRLLSTYEYLIKNSYSDELKLINWQSGWRSPWRKFECIFRSICDCFIGGNNLCHWSFVIQT